jgi:hypothetical protein
MDESNMFDPVFKTFVVYYRRAGLNFQLLRNLEQQVKTSPTPNAAYQILFSTMKQQVEKKATQKVVTDEAKRRLELADKAIAFAKEQIPFGAGNQLLAALATAGNSSRRMDKAKASAQFGQLSNKSDTSGSVALIAKATQGATCREYASLVYEFLKNTQGCLVEIDAIKGIDHTFVVLRNPGEKLSDMVVADAWPTFAQAVLLEDHFVGYQANAENLLAGSVVPGVPIGPLLVHDIQGLAKELLGSDLDAIQDGSKKVEYILTMNKMGLAPFSTCTLGPVFYKTEQQETTGFWPPQRADLPLQHRTVEEESKRLEALIGPVQPKKSELPKDAREGEDKNGKYIEYGGKRYYWCGADETDMSFALECKEEIIEKINTGDFEKLESYLA